MQYKNVKVKLGSRFPVELLHATVTRTVGASVRKEGSLRTIYCKYGMHFCIPCARSSYLCHSS